LSDISDRVCTQMDGRIKLSTSAAEFDGLMYMSAGDVPCFKVRPSGFSFAFRRIGLSQTESCSESNHQRNETFA